MGVCLPREDDLQAISYEHMAVHCECAGEVANSASAMHGDYLKHLDQAKALRSAFRLQIGRHDGFLLLYQLICEEDIAKHPSIWSQLRTLMNQLASVTREKISPYPGRLIVH